VTAERRPPHDDEARSLQVLDESALFEALAELVERSGAGPFLT